MERLSSVMKGPEEGKDAGALSPQRRGTNAAGGGGVDLPRRLGASSSEGVGVGGEGGAAPAGRGRARAPGSRRGRATRCWSRARTRCGRWTRTSTRCSRRWARATPPRATCGAASPQSCTCTWSSAAASRAAACRPRARAPCSPPCACTSASWTTPTRARSTASTPSTTTCCTRSPSSASTAACRWLQDSEVVCCLLKAIFWCENSLDNLVVGALLGIVSTHVFNAWKSDFESRQENLQALDYFLEQAGRGGLRFDPDAVADEEDVDETAPVGAGGVAGSAGAGALRPAALVATEAPQEGAPPVRVPVVGSRGPVGLADLPLRAYGKLRPLALAVLLANADAVLLLLRHGARPVDASPLYAWYGRRVADDNLAGCVRVLLRAVRWVEVVELPAEASASASAAGAAPPPLLPPPCLDGMPADVMVFAKGSPEEALVPASRRRGASPPPPLKHLARCAVRAALRVAGTLPFGLDALELPAALRAYVDLQED